MILAEELKGGQKIPEEKIAKIFGVSRTPIREALRKLEKSGLIKIVPQSHAEVVKLDSNDAEKIYEVRMFLEILATNLLAKKSTEKDYKELLKIAESCEKYADKKDIANTFLKDSNLHLEIAKRSGNQYAYEILRNLDVKIQLLRTTRCISIDKISKDIDFNFQPALISSLALTPSNSSKSWSAINKTAFLFSDVVSE